MNDASGYCERTKRYHRSFFLANVWKFYEYAIVNPRNWCKFGVVFYCGNNCDIMSAPIIITVPNTYLAVDDMESKVVVDVAPNLPSRKRRLDHLTWEEKMQRKWVIACFIVLNIHRPVSSVLLACHRVFLEIGVMML